MTSLAPTQTVSPYPLNEGYCYFMGSGSPVLEVFTGASTSPAERSFRKIGPGRVFNEHLWQIELDSLPLKAEWQFRIRVGKNRYIHPEKTPWFHTRLTSLWIQDHQVFSYCPALRVSPSRVLKVAEFTGSLPTRPLYVYLPRGYDDHPWRAYPVLYMHDGQNCFEAFAHDSYCGSWKADQTADTLIANGLMQECIIVGVSNGSKARFVEYLPPFITYIPFWQAKANSGEHPVIHPISGRADQTFAYYQEDIQPYIQAKYRILEGREHRATCGSSMGGLFSSYIAWDHPQFAKHHGIVSPAYFLTQNQEGMLEMVERFRTEPPRDLRLWLDSGTRTSEHDGNDDMHSTILARDALVENGYLLGDNLLYYLDEGAIHNECDWARRLPMIFQYLFPAKNES